MFQIDPSPTFWAPVRFEVQSADGARQVQEFRGRFPRMTEDELEAFGREIAEQRLSDRKVAARLLSDWDESVTDATGNRVPFSPQALERALNVAGVAPAVIAAFRAAQPKAALGN